MAAANVSVSGQIAFERMLFKAIAGTGLDANAPIQQPAREVVVEAVATNNTVVATTTTDYQGNYALEVPKNTTVKIRARAEMRNVSGPSQWAMRVLNNTGADALYVLDGTSFSTGNTDVTSKNLLATTGWGGVSYVGVRAAAPFAILDTLYQAKEVVRAAAPTTVFPPLDAYWSDQNRAASPFCPDLGNIVSSLYFSYGSGGTDDCSTPTPGRDGIYVLGNFQGGDTDEFDRHVIAHEFGHYIEDKFSRSDSIGGQHSLSDRLDLRVAFGEGWGDAFSGMALNDPAYRDSYSGMNADAGFNLESVPVSNPGWYSESSILSFIWDLFDSTNETGDFVSLGFAPIFNVLKSAQSTTSSLTGVFSFARAMKDSNPQAASRINTMLATQSISGVGIDEFGSTETNNAGSANVLPIYTDIGPGTPVQVCGIRAFGEYNKLSNRRFLRFQATSARTINITVSSSGASLGTSPDPDLVLWKQGVVVAVGEGTGSQEVVQAQVQIGTYIIEVYDYLHVDEDSATGGTQTCMTVSIAG